MDVGAQQRGGGQNIRVDWGRIGRYCSLLRHTIKSHRHRRLADSYVLSCRQKNCSSCSSWRWWSNSPFLALWCYEIEKEVNKENVLLIVIFSLSLTNSRRKCSLQIKGHLSLHMLTRGAAYHLPRTMIYKYLFWAFSEVNPQQIYYATSNFIQLGNCTL